MFYHIPAYCSPAISTHKLTIRGVTDEGTAVLSMVLKMF